MGSGILATLINFLNYGCLHTQYIQLMRLKLGKG